VSAVAYLLLQLTSSVRLFFALPALNPEDAQSLQVALGLAVGWVVSRISLAASFGRGGACGRIWQRLLDYPSSEGCSCGGRVGS